LKIHKRSYFTLFLFLILALSACSSSSVKADETIEDGLIINSISFGLGGSNEDLDTTVVSYNFNFLKNMKESKYHQKFHTK